MRKNRIGEGCNAQTKLKFCYLDIILKIMYGGKMAMPSNQRAQFQQWNLEVAVLWFGDVFLQKILESVIDGRMNVAASQNILEANLIFSRLHLSTKAFSFLLFSILFSSFSSLFSVLFFLSFSFLLSLSCFIFLSFPSSSLILFFSFLSFFFLFFFLSLSCCISKWFRLFIYHNLIQSHDIFEIRTLIYWSDG